jgi:hypothetical protein
VKKSQALKRQSANLLRDLDELTKASQLLRIHSKQLQTHSSELQQRKDHRSVPKESEAQKRR